MKHRKFTILLDTQLILYTERDKYSIYIYAYVYVCINFIMNIDNSYTAVAETLFTINIYVEAKLYK